MAAPTVTFWSGNKTFASGAVIDANEVVVVLPFGSSGENTKLSFSPGTELEIKDGGTLLVAGSKRSSSSPIEFTSTSGLWKGIKVNNGGHLYCFFTPVQDKDHPDNPTDFHLPPLNWDGQLITDAASGNFKLMNVNDLSNIKRFYQASKFDEVAGIGSPASPTSMEISDLITKIEVEVWTENSANSGTDNPVSCTITFRNTQSYSASLGSNFPTGSKKRATIYTSANPHPSVQNQNIRSISSIAVTKTGSDLWRCDAVIIRVNDVIVLSRYVTWDYPGTGTFSAGVQLNGNLNGLELLLRTGDATNGGTDSNVYCTVYYSGGSLPELQLGYPDRNDFERGDVYAYPIPLSSSLSILPTDITEIRIRKDGTDGWLLEGAELFANASKSPLIGNRSINQFLDDSDDMLNIVEWSTKSLVLAPGQSTYTYKLSGPVLGHITDTSAKVLYKMERQGKYRLKVYAHGSSTVLKELTQVFNPTGTFHITGLSANTHYDFKFFHILRGVEIAITEGDGEFRTFPSESSGVKFTFGVGSCVRNSHNQDQTAWTQIKNIALDPSVNPVPNPPTNDLRFFIHLGDTFYFYDDVTSPSPTNMSGTGSANLSTRKNTNFLEMAKRVPTLAVWDDHDFRGSNGDSLNYSGKVIAKKAFLDYWGNPEPTQNTGGTQPYEKTFGLTARFSIGNVDIYLMDGRYLRLEDSGVCFSSSLAWVKQDMIARNGIDRLRILVSGSTWNHTRTDGTKSAYGNSVYASEREAFYTELANLFGSTIKGLIFVSGDIHVNQIYEIVLPLGGTKKAPEFVSSPMGYNSSLEDTDTPLEERKWSKSSEVGDGSFWGFTAITVDTISSTPNGNWNVTVSYRRYDTGSVYKTQIYVLNNDQFIYV